MVAGLQVVAELQVQWGPVDWWSAEDGEGLDGALLDSMDDFYKGHGSVVVWPGGAGVPGSVAVKPDRWLRASGVDWVGEVDEKETYGTSSRMLDRYNLISSRPSIQIPDTMTFTRRLPTSSHALYNK